MNSLLKVKNLTKKYNNFTAVDDISFEVSEGEIVGFLGPNGAGKTTTIQMLLSLIEPTKGKIEIFGKDLSRNREEILENVNFVAPYAGLPYNLSVYENLLIFALIYGVKEYRNKAEHLLKYFRLSKLRNQRTGSLSSGEQTRVGLAKAFLNNPKLLLLDEPTVSLDPAIARELREKIYKLIKDVDGSVIWTSHNMREIEQMCDRVIFLSRGKIIANDKPENLKKRFKKSDLEEIFISLANS